MLPVSADFVEFVKRALFTVEDVVSGLGPGEELGLGVVLQQVIVDERGLLVELTVDAHNRTNALATPDQADAYQATHKRGRKKRKTRTNR